MAKGRLSDYQLIALRTAARGEQPAFAVEKALRLTGKRDAQRSAGRIVTMLFNRDMLERVEGRWGYFRPTAAGMAAVNAEASRHG